MQSKIAIGSGGVFGKGFMAGTQAHLDFLPEKHTDFIFTMLAEEFGFMGSLFLLALYALLLGCGLMVAIKSRSTFGAMESPANRRNARLVSPSGINTP